MDLEKLVALESKLADNYDGITDISITYDIAQFIREYPKPEDGDFLSLQFIKRITKVASNIAHNETDPTITDKLPCSFTRLGLEWIFDYITLGIKKIKSGEFTKDSFFYTQKNLRQMHSHFYSHRAKIAIKISEMWKSEVEKLEWLKTAYFDCDDSIKNSDPSEEGHCAYQHSKKGKIDFEIASLLITDKNEKIYRLNSAIANFDKAMTGLKDIDELTSSYQKYSKADALMLLSKLVDGDENKKKILRTGYIDLSDISDVLERFNKTAWAYCFKKKAEISFDLAELVDADEKNKWFEAAMENANKALEMPEQFEQYDLALLYKYRGVAKEFFSNLIQEKPKKIEGLRKCHADLEISADIFKSINKNQSYAFVKASKSKVLIDICDLLEDDSEKRRLLKISCNDSDEAIKNLMETVMEGKDWYLGMWHGFKANAEYDLSGLVEEGERIRLLRMAYLDNTICGKKTKRFNEEHSAMSYLNAGRASHDLFKITHDSTDRDNAISGYSIFANYYRKKLPEKYKALNVKVDYLLRELKEHKERDEISHSEIKTGEGKKKI